MKSKTKCLVSELKIREIFSSAKLGNVESICELSDGEFNSAYFVTAGDKQYVLKVAPKDNLNTLTYEKNVMQQEISFYKIISSQTSIKTPHVYFYDDTLKIIPSCYFIMEKLNSTPLNKCRLNCDERNEVHAKVGEMVANLHKIKGISFGYEQNGLYENWYLAIKSMTENLMQDCAQYGKKPKSGYKLLSFIEIFKDVLLKVEPRFIHFDIWDGNIFYEKKDNQTILTLIDTERGFWGDSIGDFVSIEMFSELKNKSSIATYNKTADNPIYSKTEELIRYNILRAYLGLIVYTERFARYKIFQPKYFVNKKLSNLFFDKSFQALELLK